MKQNAMDKLVNEAKKVNEICANGASSDLLDMYAKHAFLVPDSYKDTFCTSFNQNKIKAAYSVCSFESRENIDGLVEQLSNLKYDRKPLGGMQDDMAIAFIMAVYMHLQINNEQFYKNRYRIISE